MKKADLVFNTLRLPVDFLMLLTAGITTYIFRTELLSAFRPVLFEFNLPLHTYVYLVLFVSLVFIGAYAVSGLYSMKYRLSFGEEAIKIFVSSSAAILVLIIYIFLRQELFNSRFLVLGGWFFAILFVCIGRVAIRHFQNFMVSRFDFGIHRVLLVGDNEASERISEYFRFNLASGYRVVKKINSSDIEKIKESIKDCDIEELIITNTAYPQEVMHDLIDFCNENHIIFKFVPNLYQSLSTHFEVNSVNNLPIIELKRTPLDGWGKVIKRIIDVFMAVLGLLILSPLFLVCALAIKLESKGPVFVKLKRVSRNKEFKLFKFRGMIAADPDGSADSLKASLERYNERKDGPLFKMHNDPRLTKVGKFIRKYRIDEIPQFMNILRGDISLIGPRPHQPDEISKYERHHKSVLAIKAGATGLAQVSGSSDLPFEQEVILDTYYIENWSLLLDLKIIVKTIFKVLTDKSAV